MRAHSYEMVQIDNEQNEAKDRTPMKKSPTTVDGMNQMSTILHTMSDELIERLILSSAFSPSYPLHTCESRLTYPRFLHDIHFSAQSFGIRDRESHQPNAPSFPILPRDIRSRNPQQERPLSFLQ